MTDIKMGSLDEIKFEIEEFYHEDLSSAFGIYLADNVDYVQLGSLIKRYRNARIELAKAMRDRALLIYWKGYRVYKSKFDRYMQLKRISQRSDY